MDLHFNWICTKKLIGWHKSTQARRSNQQNYVHSSTDDESSWIFMKFLVGFNCLLFSSPRFGHISFSVILILMCVCMYGSGLIVCANSCHSVNQRMDCASQSWFKQLINPELVQNFAFEILHRSIPNSCMIKSLK